MVVGQFWQIEHVKVFFFSNEVHFLDIGPFVGSGYSTSLNDNITLVIDDLVQFFGRQAQQITDFIRKRTEVPDVCNRNHQGDVSHALTTYFLFGHFYTTAVTDDTFISDTLVFTTVAFVIFNRSKNALTEQAIALRFVGAVVDGFRFQNFTTRMLQNDLWRSQGDGDFVEAALLFWGFFFESHLISTIYVSILN